jgi:hypothetical protein
MLRLVAIVGFLQEPHGVTSQKTPFFNKIFDASDGNFHHDIAVCHATFSLKLFKPENVSLFASEVFV